MEKLDSVKTQLLIPGWPISTLIPIWHTWSRCHCSARSSCPPSALSKECYWVLEHLQTETLASLQGASPAGGCLIALTSDYRIMADNPKYTIGLNESLLGIVAPFW